MGAASSLVRAFWPALRQEVFRPRVGAAAAAAVVCGVALPYALGVFLPSSASALPRGAIAASFVVDLAGLAVLLVWLSPARRQGRLWPYVSAWVGTVAVMAAAFAGLAAAGAQGESARTFVVLWGLFAAQAAVLAAIHALLSAVLWVAPRVAEQATLLVLGVAVTALFWSREPIQMLAHAVPPGQANSSSRLAEGVLSLSPPLAVASVWHQESDAARGTGRRSGARFDLIRGPLTYELWIGSYQPLPYPAILPGRTAAGFGLGLILTLLACGLPLLVCGDVLLALRSCATSEPRP